jgi:hypothetical protein
MSDTLPDLDELMKRPRVIRTLQTLRCRSAIRRPDRIIMGEEAFDDYLNFADPDCVKDGPVYFCGIPVDCNSDLDPHEIQWGTPPGPAPTTSGVRSDGSKYESMVGHDAWGAPINNDPRIPLDARLARAKPGDLVPMSREELHAFRALQNDIYLVTGHSPCLRGLRG